MWVARDKDGSLFLYLKEPSKGNAEWIAEAIYGFDESRFPNVKWEDERATKVGLIPQSFVEESKNLHNQVSVVLKNMARAKLKGDKLLKEKTLSEMESLLVQIQQHLSLSMLLI